MRLKCFELYVKFITDYNTTRPFSLSPCFRIYGKLYVSEYMQASW